MSYFRDAMARFRQSFQPKPDPGPIRDVRALLDPVGRPGVRVVLGGEGRSAFFPSPQIPRGEEWPIREGQALDLLLSIDLAEVAAVHRFDWLPPEGTLQFFMDKDELWEEGFMKVLYSPPATEFVAGPPSRVSTGPHPIRFESFLTWPSSQRPEFPDLTDAERDVALDLDSADSQGYDRHQIGGFPHPVQADSYEVEAECQRLGIRYEYQDARDFQGLDKWYLLVQIDSDDHLGIMWGDVGIVYVVVHEEDSARGDFSRIFFTMQSC